MRRHTLQHAVEVVRIDLDELAILQGRKRFLRLSCQVAQDTHHEGQFLHLDRTANFNVVSDLHPGSPDATEFLLRTLSCHNAPEMRLNSTNPKKAQINVCCP